jgi:curli production assembly/transport component CsgF
MAYSKRFTSLIVLFFLLFGLSTTVFSQELVYVPKNPAFGGSPANYSWLKNSADTQNLFEEEFGTDRFSRDPLEDFQNSLQRQILSQLTRDLVLQQFGEEGNIDESRFEFGEFTIEVIPGANGVEIRIFNILTGDETSITIPNF